MRVHYPKCEAVRRELQAWLVEQSPEIKSAAASVTFGLWQASHNKEITLETLAADVAELERVSQSAEGRRR